MRCPNCEAPVEVLDQCEDCLLVVNWRIHPYAERSHCVRGHAYDEGNVTWVSKRGNPYRACKACARLLANRANERKRELRVDAA